MDTVAELSSSAEDVESEQNIQLGVEEKWFLECPSLLKRKIKHSSVSVLDLYAGKDLFLEAVIPLTSFWKLVSLADSIPRAQQANPSESTAHAIKFNSW